VAQAVVRGSLYLIETTPIEFRAEIIQADRTAPISCAANKRKLASYAHTLLLILYARARHVTGYNIHGRSSILAPTHEFT
jgi:hypothetical protein